jgi:hypothetical protein
MKKWVLLAVVVLIAVLALAPAAFAQGPFNNDGAGFSRGSMMRTGFGGDNWQQMGRAAAPAFSMGPRWGGSTGSLVTVAAEQLGMTPAELTAELQAGKTIAQVAAEKDVALDTIVEAFVAARAEQLAELVANGQLTQEQADAMLAAMRANVTARLSEAWAARGPGQGTGLGYTDQDGDGICDNFVDEDGDGVCDNAGSGGQGPGYTDEDGDGVCDHLGTGGQPGRGGRGGRMMGRWGW